MDIGVFILVLGGLCALLLGWGFKSLPQERWQMLAAIPVRLSSSGYWRGINLTYYGVFTASALLLAMILTMLLLSSIRISVGNIVALAAIVLVCALPAARLVATYVEGKAYGFTVGGASFVGMLVLPWAVVLINMFAGENRVMPIVPVLGAIAIAYAFGEGIGRLACISFGCCYGKALEKCPSWIQRLFSRYHFIFHGKNKKIAYASGLDCHKVVPIQAVTSIVYVASGLVSAVFFLTGHFRIAFALAIVATQSWRAISEIFRSDYRGNQKISAYQIMSVLAIVYMLGILWFVPTGQTHPVDLTLGLGALWHPGIVLLLQGIWIVVFLYTGRSMVTRSTISFHVVEERI